VLGSVKTNIGHAEPAAGVAGVIAAALAIRHGVLPPTVHFERPNPLIPFGDLPFEVRRQAGPWPQPRAPRIAAVSGFGFGGSNAHVVLASAPGDRREPLRIEPPYLLPVSARSPEALRALAARYRDRLGSDPAPGAICYTAAARRSHHRFRLAVTGESAGDLQGKLDGWLTGAAGSPNQPDDGRLAFVFSGQGSHWPGMGRGAYTRYAVFREAVDQISGLFAAFTGWSLVEELGKAEGESRLNYTDFAQPAIFAVQVALAALWRSWGIVPDVVVGHSLGEAAAAVAAGALSLEDGVRVVYQRSRLMKKVAGKGMTAVVGLPLDRAAEAIRGREDRLAVAGSNGPASSVLSGDPETLGGVLRALEAKGVFCRAVAGVDIAFHSPQMDPLKEELTAINQYFVHAEMCENWHYDRLGKHIKKTSIEEMKHAEALIERILFLDATPTMTDAMQLTVGQNVQAQIESDLKLEINAVAMYNRAIRVSGEEADNASRELFERLLKIEEGHVDWLEAQLHQIKEIGYERFLSQQVRDGK